jgi:Ca2+-binding EF-hand superfamily protein
LQLAGDWKNIRRAFRKLDVSGTGYLSLPEFRSVLKLANVLLDEDEVTFLSFVVLVVISNIIY